MLGVWACHNICIGKVVAESLHRCKRQIVEQFVGNYAADLTGEFTVRDFPDRSDAFGVQSSLSGRPLDGDKIESIHTCGCRGEYRAEQGARSGSPINDNESIRLIQPPPLRVERIGDHLTKQRADLGARNEIAPTPRMPATGIEAVLRVIQRQLHDVAVRHWTVAFDLLPDDGVERGHQIAQIQPPATSVTSETMFTMPGKIPNTRVANAVRPNAAWSENGTRIGTRSPSGASSAHIVRRTFK